MPTPFPQVSNSNISKGPLSQSLDHRSTRAAQSEPSGDRKYFADVYDHEPGAPEAVEKEPTSTTDDPVLADAEKAPLPEPEEPGDVDLDEAQAFAIENLDPDLLLYEGLVNPPSFAPVPQSMSLIENAESLTTLEEKEGSVTALGDLLLPDSSTLVPDENKPSWPFQTADKTPSEITDEHRELQPGVAQLTIGGSVGSHEHIKLVDATRKPPAQFQTMSVQESQALMALQQRRAVADPQVQMDTRGAINAPDTRSPSDILTRSEAAPVMNRSALGGLHPQPGNTQPGYTGQSTLQIADSRIGEADLNGSADDATANAGEKAGQKKLFSQSFDQSQTNKVDTKPEGRSQVSLGETRHSAQSTTSVTLSNTQDVLTDTTQRSAVKPITPPTENLQIASVVRDLQNLRMQANSTGDIQFAIRDTSGATDFNITVGRREMYNYFLAEQKQMTAEMSSVGISNLEIDLGNNDTPGDEAREETKESTPVQTVQGERAQKNDTFKHSSNLEIRA